MACITRIYGKILVVLLTGLGFSCGPFNAAAEYGMPRATFKTKGIVVSQTDKTPIEGIRAEFGITYEDDEYFYEIDTTYTNDKGAFNLKGVKNAYEKKLYVRLTDVGGDENGVFIDKEIEVDYSDAKFTGASGNWNRGTAEVDLGTIEMELKE